MIQLNQTINQKKDDPPNVPTVGGGILVGNFAPKGKIDPDAWRTKLDESEQGKFDSWWQTNPEVVNWKKQFYEEDKKNGLLPKGTLGLGVGEPMPFEAWQKSFSPTRDQYDYAGAYKAGIIPEKDSSGSYHWPSKGVDGKDLKSNNHPTKWKTDFVDRMGYDPDQAGIDKIQAYKILQKNAGSKMAGDMKFDPDVWDGMADYAPETQGQIEAFESHLAQMASEKQALEAKIESERLEKGMSDVNVLDMSRLNELNSGIESVKSELYNLRGYDTQFNDPHDWFGIGLQGTSTYKMLNGMSKGKYKLGNIDTGQLTFAEELGAGMVSIMFDPITYAGGFAGKLFGAAATNAAQKIMVAKLVEGGMKSPLAKVVANNVIAKKLAYKLGLGAAQGGMSFGVFEAGQDLVNQKVEQWEGIRKDISYGQMIRHYGEGFGLGSMLSMVPFGGNILTQDLEKRFAKNYSSALIKGSISPAVQTAGTVFQGAAFTVGKALIDDEPITARSIASNVALFGAMHLAHTAPKLPDFIFRSSAFKESAKSDGEFKGMYKTNLTERDFKDLGVSSIEDLNERIDRNPQYVQRIMDDKNIALTAKVNIMWGKYGLGISKDIIPTKMKAIKNQDGTGELELRDSEGSLITRKQFGTHEELDSEAVVMESKFAEMANQKILAQLTAKGMYELNSKIPENFKDEEIETLNSALIKSPESRTAEESRQSDKFYKLASDIKTQADADFEAGIKNDLVNKPVVVTPEEKQYKAQGLQKAEGDISVDNYILPKVKTKTIEPLINDGTFISAENKMNSPEANAALTSHLRDYLKRSGIEFEESVGQFMYGDGTVSKEKSFVIKDMPLSDAVELAKEFGQDGIITKEGYVDISSGKISPSVGIEMGRTKGGRSIINVDGQEMGFSKKFDFGIQKDLGQEIRRQERQESYDKKIAELEDNSAKAREEWDAAKKKLKDDLFTANVGINLNILEPLEVFVRKTAKLGYAEFEKMAAKSNKDIRDNLDKLRPFLQEFYDNFKKIKLPRLKLDEPDIPIGIVEEGVSNLFKKNPNPTAAQFAKLKLGAPTKPRSWEEMNHFADEAIRLFPETRTWYQDYSHVIRSIVGNNMPEASGVFGITSWSTAPQANLNYTLHIMALAREVDPVKNPAEFKERLLRLRPFKDPETGKMSMKVTAKMPVYDPKTKTVKLESVKMSGSQADAIIKFYKTGHYDNKLKSSNYANQIAIGTGDPYSGLSVIDRHMTRLFGNIEFEKEKPTSQLDMFPETVEKKGKAGFDDNQVRVTTYLTAKLAQDRGIRADEMQAMLWHYAISHFDAQGNKMPQFKIDQKIKSTIYDKGWVAAKEESTEAIKKLNELKQSGKFDINNPMPQFPRIKARISPYVNVATGTVSKKRPYDTTSRLNDIAMANRANRRNPAAKINAINSLKEKGIGVDGESVVVYAQSPDIYKIEPNQVGVFGMDTPVAILSTSKTDGSFRSGINVDRLYDIEADPLGIYERAQRISDDSRFGEMSVSEPTQPKAMPEGQLPKTIVPKSAKLTPDGQGNYLFFHYGDVKGKSIKPSMFGQHRYTSEKRSGGASFYYTKPGEKETMITSENLHVVKVPMDKVYPFNADPLNLIQKGRVEFEKENPGKAYDINEKAMAVNRLAGDLGFEMVVAKWGAKPMRAETTKEFEYDPDLTNQFRRNGRIATDQDRIDNAADDIRNSVSKKINKASWAQYAGFYYTNESNMDKLLSNPNIRKMADPKLVKAYEDLRDAKTSEVDPESVPFTSTEPKLKALDTVAETAKSLGYDGMIVNNSGNGNVVVWNKVNPKSRDQELAEIISDRLQTLGERLFTKGIEGSGKGSGNPLSEKSNFDLAWESAKAIAELAWRKGTQNIKKYVFDELSNRLKSYGITREHISEFEADIWKRIEDEKNISNPGAYQADNMSPDLDKYISDKSKAEKPVIPPSGVDNVVSKADIKNNKENIRNMIMDRTAFLATNAFKTNKFTHGLRGEFSKSQREVIPFIIEKTRPPDELNRPDLQAKYDWYMTDSNMSADLMEAPKFHEAVKKVRKYYEDMFSLINENYDNMSDKEVKDYVTHMWAIPKVGSALNKYLSRQAMSNPYLKGRYIGTMAEGIKNGLTPKTTDIAEILEGYSRITHRAIANRNFAQALKDFEIAGQKLILKSGEAPHDWLPINHPAFQYKQYVPTKDGKGILRETSYRVHPDFAKYVNLVFSSDSTSSFMHAYDVLGGYLKKTALSLSLFHHGALTEVALPTMGLKSLKINPLSFVWNGLIKGDKAAFLQKEELVQDAIKHGVQIGASSDMPIAQIQQQFDALAAKTKGVPGVAQLTKGLSKFNERWDSALWEYLHDGYKLLAYEHFISKMPQSADPIKYKREIAQFVNDSFGGQNWQNIMISPSTLKIMQRLLLSPDWTISTARHALSATGAGSIYNSPEMRKLRATRGLVYWGKVFMYYGLGMNALNYTLRKKDMEENPDLYPEGMSAIDKTMFGNAPGHKSHLFMGRNDDGTERYMRFGKQFRELYEFMFDESGFSPVTAGLKKIGGKANPILNAASETATGYSLSGFKNKEIADARSWDRTLGIVKNIGRYWAPMSSRQLMTDKAENWTPWNLVMPTSSGMSVGKGIDLFKGEFEHYANTGDLDNHAIKEIYTTALRNNLNPYEMITSAMQIYKAEKTNTLTENIKSLDDVERALEETDNLMDKKRLINVKKDLLRDVAEQKRAMKLWELAQKKMEIMFIKEGLVDSTNVSKGVEEYNNKVGNSDIIRPNY